MRVIASSTLRDWVEAHRDAEAALSAWLKVVEAANWASLQDVRRVYPTADGVALPSGHTVTVFNIKGNRYRLIVGIHYGTQKVFLREFLTHAEYDKPQWKQRN